MWSVGAVLGIIFGLILVGLGGIMVSNYQTWGTQIVEKTVPRTFRVGDADIHRKFLGYSYLAGGLLFIIVAIAVLAT
jgi:hypothetical protein